MKTITVSDAAWGRLAAEQRRQGGSVSFAEVLDHLLGIDGDRDFHPDSHPSGRSPLDDWLN